MDAKMLGGMQCIYDGGLAPNSVGQSDWSHHKRHLPCVSLQGYAGFGTNSSRFDNACYTHDEHHNHVDQKIDLHADSITQLLPLLSRWM